MERKPFYLEDVRESLTELKVFPEWLRRLLLDGITLFQGPSVSDFTPHAGHPGCALEVRGNNFAAVRSDNQVRVGGKPAFVVSAAADRLRVLTDPQTASGPVEVTVNGALAAAPNPFQALPYPKPLSQEDGPPILFEGRSPAGRGDLPGAGDLRVLVSLINPSDVTPANPAARQAIADIWDKVKTFYTQASYGRLNLKVDILANWHKLSGDKAAYIDNAVQNVASNARQRVYAEAAQAAVNEGKSLDNYDLMACVLFLDGTFIRAWGGESQQNFTFNDPASGTNINVTANHDVNLLIIGESEGPGQPGNWGRFAHETGHNLISSPAFQAGTEGTATLGEDVYSSDLVDPNAATAAEFEIMGDHNSHPLFSGYHLDKLKWYKNDPNDPGNNVKPLQWDRNAFSQEFEVAAHGLAENTAANRFHLLKIRVTDGLFYLVEVRQRPGATAQIFDDSIPLGAATHEGGVVVTRVIADTMNNNQQTRFLTLLHDPQVLKQGDSAIDPARALKITVVNDNVVARPLVCRVRVEWAQGVQDDPNGAFDLSVEPWDGNYQSPDIWVDRAPFGTFDQPNDAQGRPQGNGDKPRPKEVNHFFARVHCQGSVGASDVRATFYTVFPPGVGDNGNWTPLQTRTVANINANGSQDVSVNWVPLVGQHTCLKVFVEQQLGEVSGGNNSAQENVFDFEAPASSVPDPVVIPVAVRNPRKDPAAIAVHVGGVPAGYRVHFPHSWLWLQGLEERALELTVVPTLDYSVYRERKESATAAVRVVGHVPRQYQELLPGDVVPASRMSPIGGVTARVTPKRRVDVVIHEGEGRDRQHYLAVRGALSPALAGERVRVDLTDPGGKAGVLSVVTDGGGQFQAEFDLTVEPSLEARPAKGARRPVAHGTYRVQAFVLASPHAAEASSNVLALVR